LTSSQGYFLVLSGIEVYGTLCCEYSRGEGAAGGREELEGALGDTAEPSFYGMSSSDEDDG
jgi:hypothetical protein